MVTPSLLDAIKVAKENEQIASVSYREAAEEIQHSVGKRLFQELSDFERFHYEKLTELENSLIKEGKYINYEGREFPIPAVLEVRGAVEPGKKSVMTIIAQAIGLEETAKNMYADLAKKIDDPQGKDMFTRLAAEEYLHYRALIEAYWTVNNFGVWKWVQP